MYSIINYQHSIPTINLGGVFVPFCHVVSREWLEVRDVLDMAPRAEVTYINLLFLIFPLIIKGRRYQRRHHQASGTKYWLSFL